MKAKNIVSRAKVALSQDEVVAIPENRLRFFGGPGRMLLPCPATLAALLKKVPAGRVTTSKHMQAELARMFNVRGVCPVTFRHSLAALSANDAQTAPYWRVVKATGEMFNMLHGGAAEQARRLQHEGISINTLNTPAKLDDLGAFLLEPDLT